MSPAVPLWDIVVRLVHWSMALLLPLAWYTAEEGYLERHAQIGYALTVLLLTRLLWGFVGSRHARFSDFLRGPAGVAAYLRGSPSPTPGHNPLGGWSVVTVWLLLGVQLLSGMLNSDGILFDGPLYPLASEAVSDTAGELHEIVFNVLIAWVVLHLLAFAWYQWRCGQDLLRPMVTGHARDREGAGHRVSPLWALLFAAVLSLALWGAFELVPEPESYW